MASPLKIGIAGLGTVGASVVRLIERQRDALAARCGRPIEVVAVSARSRGKKRDLGRKSLRWVADPVTLATDPEIDVFVELMGGEGDPAKAAISAALAAKKSVVTANKALLARHGVAPRGDGREEPGGAQFRSRGRRRHPDREDAARGSGRQFARPHLWNSQRHLQLHPDPHGAGEARLRRLPEGGAAARLCRGRSDFRHRGPRYGAEARHPGQPRLRHQGRSERRLCGGHLVHRIGRPGMGGRARLSREAARGRGAGRTKASSSACIRPWCRKTPRSRR